MISIDKKNKIKELYKEGVKPKQILEKLILENESITLGLIQKYIRDELKDLKEIHKKNARKKLIDDIAELYRNGSTSIQIGNQVGLSSGTVSNYISIHLGYLRDEHIKNSKVDLINRITDSYKKGLTTTEIARDLGMSSASTVRNYTMNLSEEIKNEHETNYKTRLDIRRENNRIFNQTSNSDMCTRAAVIQNRQSYYTDKDGNLRFDIRRGALPCDMPAVFATQF